MSVETLSNYIGGEWLEAQACEVTEVVNPATGQALALVPLGEAEEVARAVGAASTAFPGWRRTPVAERVRPLMRLRELMGAAQNDLAVALVREHGKTLDEAKVEVSRALDNLEVASAASSLTMGETLEGVARGVDEYTLRQPLGVFAGLCPFNFPAMIPFWFLPYAVAAGNTYVVKPSPITPMTLTAVFDLVQQAGFPPGVVNLLHGGGEAGRALIDHPEVRGISFVGSTAVGREVYARAARQGKRVQVQAGAKNFAVVMPDAVLERVVPNIVASAFDCSGQRCLALAAVLAVGEVYEKLASGLVETAGSMIVGHGLNDGVDMGPVISPTARERIEGCIARAEEEGAKVLLDGRGITVEGLSNGNWMGPTILGNCSDDMTVVGEEIFGPVLCLLKVRDLDEALGIIRRNPYGNAASIFTQSGKAARHFRYHVGCGNVGINIGVAAPMAYFHFGGTKQSFFGDLHGQGGDAFRFFTEGVVVVERWF